MSTLYSNFNSNNNFNNIDDSIYYLGSNYLNLGSFNSKNKNVNVLLYTINKYTVVPYISFLLHKNSNTLNAIKFNYVDYSTPFNIEKKLSNMFDFIKSVKYKGFFNFNNEIYLFYEYYRKSLNFNLEFNKLTYIDVIVSEIINYNKVFDYIINKSLVNLFLKNKLFNYLKQNNNILEIPEIYYKYHDHYNIYNVINDDYKLNHNNYYEFYPIDSLNINKKKYVFKYIIFAGFTNISNKPYINENEKMFNSILYVNKKTNYKIINIKNFNQIYFRYVYKIY